MLASFFCFRTGLSLCIMQETVDISQVLSRPEIWQIIDVRSPAEYQSGHIPGAVNIPLFTDEQRAQVGTLYTQVSPEIAFRQGLDFAGSRMGLLVDEVKTVASATDRELLIHCWRGGKRSQAVQWLYQFAGNPVRRINGGYKSYRAALQSYFTALPFTLKLLGGCTGAGKTEILQALADRGEQVIDLENLAHHKGSAFGSIGEERQPTTEQFENDLFASFLKLDPSRPVWLENESKNIGKVNIPDGLWAAMRASVLYAIEVDIQVRLKRILRYYSEPVDIGLLKQSFEKIYKRVGGLEFQKAMHALDAQDLETAALVALTYYDKAYRFQQASWPEDLVRMLHGCEDVSLTAERLAAI